MLSSDSPAGAQGQAQQLMLKKYLLTQWQSRLQRKVFLRQKAWGERGSQQRRNKSGHSPVSQEVGIIPFASPQEQRRGDKSDEFREEISMRGQAAIAQGVKQMLETKEKKMKVFFETEHM